LIYAAMIGIFSPIAGVCCDQFGYRRPIIFAALMSFLGFLLLALLNLHSSIYFILSALFFIGVANGIMIPATVNSTLSSLPESSTGEGVGMFYTLGFMSGSLGIAISGAQIDIISSHHLMQFSTAWLNQLNPSQIKLVNHIANGTRPVSELVEKLPTADFQVVGQLAKQAFIKGFSAVMWVLSALCLIATVLAFLLKRSVNTNQ
nr:MFS transporter [Gammaproteobacteria bacterium]